MTTLINKIQAIQAEALDPTGGPEKLTGMLDVLMAETDKQAKVMTDLLAGLQAENERLRAELKSRIDEAVCLRQQLTTYKEREKTMGWSQS